MNTALKTTAVDLERSLRKALFGGAVERQVEAVAKRLANQLVATNEVAHPGLESKVMQTGPLSFSIELEAPGLWSSVFGTLSQGESGIDFPGDGGDMSAIRGET